MLARDWLRKGGLLLPDRRLRAPKLAIGNPVKIGSASSAASGTSSFSITTSGAVPAGALMVVGSGVVSINVTVNVTAISATDGTNTNNFVPAIQIINQFEVLFLDTWYCPNAKDLNAGATVTVSYGNSFGSGGGGAATVCYATGVATSNPFDYIAQNTNSGSIASSQAVPISTAAPLFAGNEVLFGGSVSFAASGTTGITEDPTFTNLDNVSLPGSRIAWDFAYQVETAGGSVTYSPTLSATGTVFYAQMLAPFANVPVILPVVGLSGLASCEW